MTYRDQPIIAPIWRWAVAKLHDLAAARARQAAQKKLKAAEAELANVEAQFDEDCGIGVNLTLRSRLRAAERRVEEARSELQRVDPSAQEGGSSDWPLRRFFDNAASPV